MSNIKDFKFNLQRFATKTSLNSQSDCHKSCELTYSDNKVQFVFANYQKYQLSCYGSKLQAIIETQTITSYTISGQYKLSLMYALINYKYYDKPDNWRNVSGGFDFNEEYYPCANCYSAGFEPSVGTGIIYSKDTQGVEKTFNNGKKYTSYSSQDVLDFIKSNYYIYPTISCPSAKTGSFTTTQSSPNITYYYKVTFSYPDRMTQSPEKYGYRNVVNYVCYYIIILYFTLTLQLNIYSLPIGSDNFIVKKKINI